MARARKLTQKEINYVIKHIPKSNDKLHNMVVKVCTQEMLKDLKVPPEAIPEIIRMLIAQQHADTHPDGSLKEHLLIPNFPPELQKLMDDNIQDVN